MARRGKFARLVEQFVSTADELGGAVDPDVVAEELQTRIDAIATQLRITPQTVLRSYIDEDWGAQMATAMMNEVRRLDPPASGPPEHIAVRVAARLQAALGQALIYAAINDDPKQPSPAIDLQQAGEAVSGLALAIRDAPLGQQYVTVGADVASWTRATLEVFRDQLATGRWTFCPCGERHGQDETDTQVLAAVRHDLLHLAPAPAAHPGT